MRITLQDFHFFLSAKGLFGLIPTSSVGCEIMDQITFLDGFKVPFLLLNASRKDAKILLGPYFVEGLMGCIAENQKQLGRGRRL
jgi:hypothetical protein